MEAPWKQLNRSRQCGEGDTHKKNRLGRASDKSPITARLAKSTYSIQRSLVLRRIALLAALVLALPVNAQDVDENYTAEKMLRLCEGAVVGEDLEVQSLVCTFRMQGVTAILIENCLSLGQGFSPVTQLTSKRPPSRGAARQAFKNYMASNPDKWGLPWHQVVALSISETFPCTP